MSHIFLRFHIFQICAKERKISVNIEDIASSFLNIRASRNITHVFAVKRQEIGSYVDNSHRRLLQRIKQTHARNFFLPTGLLFINLLLLLFKKDKNIFLY